MANRNINPVRAPGFELTLLSGGFKPFSTTPSTTPLQNVGGEQWFSAFRLSPGAYNLVLKDRYPGLYGVNLFMDQSTLDMGDGILIPRFVLSVGPPAVTLQGLFSSGAPLPISTFVTGTNGTVAEASDDGCSAIYFTLLVRNSMVR